MNKAIVLYELWTSGETNACGIEIRKDSDPKIFLYTFEALSKLGGSFLDINFLDKKNSFGHEVIETECIEFDEDFLSKQVERIADFINEKIAHENAD